MGFSVLLRVLSISHRVSSEVTAVRHCDKIPLKCVATLSEFGLGVSKEELLELYEYATREKFSPLVIDMEADPAERFRKGVIEILNV